jgi:sugar lactone lactonase YvrE
MQEPSSNTKVGFEGFRDGIGTSAFFRQPDDIVITPDGTMYVADAGNNAIRRIREINGQAVVDTIAGTGIPGFADGDAMKAEFNGPTGLALSLDSRFLYIADSFNERIRKLDLINGLVSTLAGNTYAGDLNGPGIDASFYIPIGIVVDSDGSLYVTENERNRVRRVDPDNGNSRFLAGWGWVRAKFAAKFINGPGAIATFSRPRGIAIDRMKRELYVADSEYFRIRKIALP